MKLTVSKDKFLGGLQAVQNVVANRVTLPILSNTLLRCEDGQLSLATTDLDMAIQSRTEATIERAGATTLPAKRLFNIVRELPSTDIVISSDSSHVATIKSGLSVFRINGLAESEFPPMPTFAGAKEFTLTQKDLRDALRKTSYAISVDETRYVLNGILAAFKEDKLTMVATDGRRLALVELEMEIPKSNETEIIIPTKAVNELQRLLNDEGDVKVSVGDSQAAFDFGHTKLITKLIEGNYPNYRQVIPTETRERVTLEREPFLNAVRRVSLLASEKSNSVKLVFGKNNLDIMANTPEVGEASESMPISYKGAEMSIAFNPEFLMAPLRILQVDEVYLDLIAEGSPGVMKIKTPFLYVLMPMRIT